MKTIEFDLGLSDDSFWKGYDEDQVFEKFLDVDEHTIGIGTPKEIDSGERESFPLVIYQNGTPKDISYYDLSQSALAVTINVDRNMLSHSVAWRPLRRRKPKKPTNDQSYMSVISRQVDLNEKFRLEMRSGKYLTVVISREYVSNRVETVVKAGFGFYDNEEVEKFIEEHRKNVPAPEVWPPFIEKPRKAPLRPLSLPIYSKYEGSPELPKEIGISVEPTRVEFARKGVVCLIRGSFRLPANYGRFVPPAQRSKDKSQPVEYLRMPIHIIITGEKSPNPFAACLMVPVYDEVKGPKEDKPVTGYFAFDLLKHADLTETPQTYFLYLFSGEVMVGPVPFAFVDPKEIEP